MPLTPADVHHVAFSRPPLGKRGYHEDEVDAFLDLVGVELARLIEENKDLRNQVERLDRQLRPLQSAEPVVAPVPPPGMKQTSPGGDHQVQAVKVLGLAQEIADRLTGEAQTEADAMLRNARNNSAQLLSQARAKADGMVNDARTRAETMLHDAHTRAETLDRQSRDKAAALERDAARKHTEIIGSISQEKTILEKKIDELRTFEHEYRTRLATYLDAQLRELDGGGSAGARAESGSHRCDPEIRTTGAGATRPSARGEAPDTGIRHEPGTSRTTSRTPWKPAVELDGVGDRGAEQWPPVQRSVS